jgi:GntR family negative regulator for fad regulon and positive regulator of fabA
MIEERLLRDILDGVTPPGSSLPNERQLAARLGVTRPTLREVLSRLERDGWVSIRHGKPTLVNDVLRQGGLQVLTALAEHSHALSRAFIPHLLEARVGLAPHYTELAVSLNGEAVARYLAGCSDLRDDPESLSRFDWGLHHELTVLSANPVYTMIINGFRGVSLHLGPLYFARPEARNSSRRFYAELRKLAEGSKALEAAALTRKVMAESLRLWQDMTGDGT